MSETDSPIFSSSYGEQRRHEVEEASVRDQARSMVLLVSPTRTGGDLNQSDSASESTQPGPWIGVEQAVFQLP